MKSQEHVLLLVERGILADASSAYPTVRGFDLDMDRILTLVENRGLGFFTLDLPNLDALLLEGLETGRLTLQGPLSHNRSKKIRVPRLFSGLWLRVFHKTGVLKENPDVTAIAFLRQLCCLGKKVEVECSRDRVIDTMREYHKIEQEMRRPSLRWDDDILRSQGLSLDESTSTGSLSFFDGLPADLPLFPDESFGTGRNLRSVLRNLEHVCSMVSSSFGSPDPYYISESGSADRGTSGPRGALRHGPGAVSNQRRDGDKYHFPHWPDKLQHHFPFDAFGVLNLNHLWDRDYPSPSEPPSKLICVPKTAKAPRLIASEPSCHQWTQQLLASFVVSRLEMVFGGDFITIKDQNPSRKMASVGSLDRSLSTIDLSSASDRLSCWLVERVFRGNQLLLELLHATRTRSTFDGVSREKSFLRLKKFSTQGSALTFPIQSVVFLCCALAVLPRENSIGAYRSRWAGKVRVFGDDIIVPNDRYADMCDLLHYLGLAVGVKKSFHRGFFRESCGLDAYQGFDVTPVKPKTLMSDTPEGCNAVIDTSNNLFKKGYWHAATALESTLPKRAKQALPVVGPLSGTLGLTSFCGDRYSHLKQRWNPDLQRYEARTFGFRSKVLRKQFGGYTGIFQYVTERPSPLTKWENGQPVKVKTRDGLYWVPLPPQVVPAARLSA